MANNQVTVRFESTIETNENNRISYIPTKVFIEVDKSTEKLEGEYYIIINNMYEKCTDPLNENGSLYKKVLKNDYLYYIKKDNIYVEATNNDIHSVDSQIFYLSEMILMSGPVEIFATVDTFDELESQEMTDIVLEYLSGSDKSVIVFVSDVTGYENNYRSRGAYYLLSDVHDTPDGTKLIWQEILLGTHSHSNMEVLEKLSEISLLAGEETKNIVVNSDGTFGVQEISKNNLPDLPESFKKKLEEFDIYNSLEEPTEFEGNHLDAPFDEIITYDENGNPVHNTTAFANCRDLYRSLLRSGKKLYIDSDNDFKIGYDETPKRHWVTLDAFKLNFSLDDPINDNIIINVTEYPANSELLTVELETLSNIGNVDEVFLIAGKSILKEDSYKILEINKNKIKVVFFRSVINLSGVNTFTVLTIRDVNNDPLYRGTFIAAYNSGKINIVDINNELVKTYIENEFARKPVLPKLYLTTSDEGKIVWENKLLPSQSFYAKSIDITNSNIDIISIKGRNYAKIVFEGANYRLDEDFPIMMIDEMYVFNIKPEISDSGKDLIYYIPVNPEEGEGHYDFDLQDGETRKVTLIIVKNGVSATVDELAGKYVTKEDAITILSHGRIKLDEFTKKKELLAYTKLGHKHSQYALKDHTHDARYATFHHSHPEMIASILAVLNNKTADAGKIEQVLNQITTKNKDLLQDFIVELGLEKNKYIGDHNVIVSDDIALELIKKANETLGQTDFVEGQELWLYDAIDLIIRIFENDTVTDNQVELESDIIVNLRGESLGGVKDGKVYRAGKDTLQTILRDMLSPYVDLDEMRKIMTPDARKSIIRWYTVDSTDNVVEIDTQTGIEFSFNPVPILFSVELRNEFNEECKYNIVLNGLETEMRTEIHDIILDGKSVELSTFGDTFFSGKQYYVYDMMFQPESLNYNTVPYEIGVLYSTNLDGILYDNYGQTHTENGEKTKLNPNNKYMNVEGELKVNYPDMIYGCIDYTLLDSSIANIENIISDYINGAELTGFIRQSNADCVELGVNTRDTNMMFAIIESSLYDDIKDIICIHDSNSHTNVTKFFKILDSNIYPISKDIPYTCLYYISKNRNVELNLEIYKNKNKCR